MSQLRRLLNLFSRTKVDQEIAAELRSHIEMRIEDNVAAGMSAEEARRDALLRFGNVSCTQERVVGADAALALFSILSDIRHACRQLWKNPGFACTAILVLALGVGASVAMFAFIDAVLIRPLPYQNPSRLMELFESTPLGPRYHLSYLDYLDWKKQNRVFSSLEAYQNLSIALHTAVGTQPVDGSTVTAGFFRTLAVTPVVGRDFRDGEDTASAPRTVILSYSAWQNRYGKRKNVLGQVVTLDGESNVVIGVLPPDFHFAPAGQAEFWTALHAASDPDSRGEHKFTAIARLKNGVTPWMASLDMSSIAKRLAKEYPDSDEGRGATVVPLTEVIVGNLRPILYLLMSGALLLLMIACVNVSGLILVRSQNRRHEFAIRGAMGASRLRLVRQFMTEGVLLATTGSVVGMGAAYGAIHLLTLLVPVNMLADMPYMQGLGLNLHVVCFAAAIGLAMATLFSLTPMFRLPLTDLHTGLGEGNRTAASTVWRRLGANLVVLQLSIAMVLLVGAGLLGKSFYRLLHTAIGVRPDHLAMLRLVAPPSDYPKPEQVIALARRLMEETRRLPGVESVAVTHQVPVANAVGGNTTFEIIGHPRRTSNEASSRQVSVGYFTTMEARLLRGRYFSEGDDASKPRVMIVNHSFARKYFPGESPIGKRIRYDASQPAIEIIGIVDDIREGPLDEEVQPVLYTPFNQEPGNLFFVVVRTIQPPHELLKSLEGTLHRIDPDILTFDPETMEDHINRSQSAYLHRSSAWLVGGFAAIALLLGMVGLYGVIAYSVSQRTREIGIRMALGAQRGSVYRMVLREAGWLTAVGIIAGLICSVATATLMRKLLFGTEPRDASTFVGVAVLLAASALLASYIPARRAASVDPVQALRSE